MYATKPTANPFPFGANGFIAETGWDSIWFTEHHLNHEGMEACPDPLLMSADIAARTQRIRLGQAANIITFWNPLRIAEDIAMLDHLSGGRIEVGLGRGGQHGAWRLPRRGRLTGRGDSPLCAPPPEPLA